MAHTVTSLLQVCCCITMVTGASLVPLNPRVKLLKESGDWLTRYNQAMTNSTARRLPHGHIDFVISQSEVCGSDPVLLIVVCSAAANFQRRQLIRQTWGSVSRSPELKAKVVFLLGLNPGQNGSEAQIQKEATVHEDIIQANFVDTYRNLSMKSVAMLLWTNTFCSRAKYLLKTDDDMFVNTKVLLEDLKGCVHRRFIMGRIIAAGQPHRDPHSKWYTPKDMYPHAMYPDYVSGTAYLISNDLFQDLYASAVAIPLFIWEDVFITGMCSKKAKAQLVFNAKFNFDKKVITPCSLNSVITGHEMTSKEVRTLWSAVNGPTSDCIHH